MSRVIIKSGIKPTVDTSKILIVGRTGLRCYLKRLKKQNVKNEKYCRAAGWTYPNTADKGSSMTSVNNYSHKLKLAIGGVEAADKNHVIVHL